MTAIKRESKPSKTQLGQDLLIAERKLVRYVLASLKDDSLVEMVDEGPFTNKPGQQSFASVGRQQILAALRKTIDDLPVFVAVEAHVSDGAGGIKVVKGKAIPPVFDNAVGRSMPVPVATPEWDAARAEHNKARNEVAQRGKAAVGQSLAAISADVVAVAEKNKPSRNSPAT